MLPITNFWHVVRPGARYPKEECSRGRNPRRWNVAERNAHRTECAQNGKISISRRFAPCHRDFQNKVSISPRESGFSRFIEIPHSASQTASSQESLKFQAFSRLTIMLDASRNLNISSKLPFARLVETFFEQSLNIAARTGDIETLVCCPGNRRRALKAEWIRKRMV